MKTVLYPGSFDPVTNGHIDVIRRASVLFDRVVVAVARNSEKNALFSTAERIELIRKACPDLENLEVTTFEGLMVDSLKKFQATAVIRGLRAVADFEYEFQMALMNRELNPDCETLFMMPSPEYSFVSSRLIKEIARCNGSIDKFVPPCVEEAMRQKFAEAAK